MHETLGLILNTAKKKKKKKQRDRQRHRGKKERISNMMKAIHGKPTAKIIQSCGTQPCFGQ
jgi:hypothetical protein